MNTLRIGAAAVAAAAAMTVTPVAAHAGTGFAAGDETPGCVSHAELNRVKSKPGHWSAAFSRRQINQHFGTGPYDVDELGAPGFFGDPDALWRGQSYRACWNGNTVVMVEFVKSAPQPVLRRFTSVDIYAF